MDENDLEQIAWRAGRGSHFESAFLSGSLYAQQVIEEDVPRLIAEIRQLNAKLQAVDPFTGFRPGTIVHIEVVFPGEYRIGFGTTHINYLPGMGSYYPFREALDKCIDSYHDVAFDPDGMSDQEMADRGLIDDGEK